MVIKASAQNFVLLILFWNEGWSMVYFMKLFHLVRNRVF